MSGGFNNIVMASKTFKEGYTIKANYLKNDGFYEYLEQTIYVDVIHGINEKNNHRKAKQLFLEQNKHLKKLEVTRVIYQ